MPFPDIDPVVFSFEVFGFTLALRWYALAYIAGLLFGWWLIRALMRRPQLWPENRAPMQAEWAEDLLTWMILSVVIGGRLGFVIFYNLGYYLENPADIIRVWDGGMSFHGGFIGVIVGTVIWARIKHVPLLQLGDAVAIAAPVGLMLGRISNFINAELWGRPTTSSWGVAFPGARAQDCPAEFGSPCLRHASQLYEAALEGLFLFTLMLALVFFWRILKRPGVLIGVFFIGYGAARTFVEGFRQADAQFVSADNPMGHVLRFGTEAGLTMGQLLSLPMVGIGLIVILWAVRRGQGT